MKIKTPIIVGFLLIIVVGIPATLYLALTQQNNQSSAHSVAPSAKSECKDGFVQITFTDIINDLPNGVTATTIPSDTLALYNEIQFTSKVGGPPTVIVKSTNKNVLAQGEELIHSVTTFSDGFRTLTNDTPVAPAGPCVSPTPTPLPGSTPTPTSIPPTATPACTLPSSVNNVKIICQNCNQ